MSLPILTLEALNDLADDISPGPWSLDDRLEYVDGDGDPLLTDNGAVIYQPDEGLFLAAPAVLATARSLYADLAKANARLDLAREILEEAIKTLPPHDPNADHVRAMARTWLEESP